MSKLKDMYPYNRGPNWPKMITMIIIAIMAMAMVALAFYGLYCELMNC